MMPFLLLWIGEYILSLHVGMNIYAHKLKYCKYSGPAMYNELTRFKTPVWPGVLNSDTPTEAWHLVQ